MLKQEVEEMALSIFSMVNTSQRVVRTEEMEGREGVSTW
jgi:hypothetical protein